MASSADWVLSGEVQEAIQRFAEQTWTVSHLRARAKAANETKELVEDAQAEFELAGSWARVGEAFDLVTDEDKLGETLEMRHAAAEQELDALNSQIRREEAAAAATKKIISAALGERVRLDMH